MIYGPGLSATVIHVHIYIYTCIYIYTYIYIYKHGRFLSVLATAQP